jgi:hypothetical protein
VLEASSECLERGFVRVERTNERCERVGGKFGALGERLRGHDDVFSGSAKVPRLERTNEQGEDVSEEEASSEAYCVDVIKY